MDDFVISNLNESRNEWCSRLVSIFTPLVADGIRSIFDEAWKMCVTNEEVNKYLMTFQNLLSHIPKWNNSIIEQEKTRIIERSGCNYLEDLVTCVHIIQLKIMTCIRVGNKQKKIDITIPKLDVFIHKVYILVARKVYSNVHLFEKNISPLQQQKNNRELEIIIQECIMNTIRESIPTEEIIRAYMDESIEQEEEVYIENIEEPEEKEAMDGSESSPENEVKTSSQVELEKEEKLKEIIDAHETEEPPKTVSTIENANPEEKVTSTTLSFNDIDSVLDSMNSVKMVDAPKDIEHLEEISTNRALEQKMQEEEDDFERLKVDTTQDLKLMDFDVLEDQAIKNLDNDSLVLNDIDELPAVAFY
jgi:DNA polymerase III alpha subunit (gram-positive type)